MSFEIATVNLSGAFSDQERARLILPEIVNLDANVLAMPEAYNEANMSSLPAVEGFFKDCGYQVLHTPYADEDNRKDRRGIMVVTNLDANLRIARLGTRNAIAIEARSDDGTDYSMVAAHLDDRNEESREHQAHYMTDILESSGLPAIAFGDLNYFPHNSFLGMVLRAALPVVKRMRAREPEIGNTGPGLDRAVSILRRAGEMAAGRTEKTFRQAGFVDADTSHRKTARVFGRYLLQLDHILYRDTVASNPRVIRRPDLTDHAILQATIGR